MSVVDIHTHLVTERWLDAIRAHGGPRYRVEEPRPGLHVVMLGESVFVPVLPKMFDREERLQGMDEGGVDISVASLVPPCVDWGEAVIAASMAQFSNDTLASLQDESPDRFRWLASIPWEHADDAVAELERACANGAIGLIMPASINGRALTDPLFAPVWQAVDARALPVLIHPTAPPGAEQVKYEYHLLALVAFMHDTTLAVSNLIYDGFLDRYPALKLVVPHAGATLPFIVGRLDGGFRHFPACSVNISELPSSYLKRLWYDDVAPGPESLHLCMKICGADKIVHGSDYPFGGFGDRLDPLDRPLRKAILEDNPERLFEL